MRHIGDDAKMLPAFLERLVALDDKTYRTGTSDFRNRASHAIAPRLEEGFTQMVTRSVGPYEDFVQQTDGTFKRVPDPNRLAVYYGFGGTPPLPLKTVRTLVAGEYKKARAAVEAYLDLVRDTIAGMPTCG